VKRNHLQTNLSPFTQNRGTDGNVGLSRAEVGTLTCKKGHGSGLEQLNAVGGNLKKATRDNRTATNAEGSPRENHHRETLPGRYAAFQAGKEKVENKKKWNRPEKSGTQRLGGGGLRSGGNTIGPENEGWDNGLGDLSRGATSKDVLPKSLRERGHPRENQTGTGSTNGRPEGGLEGGASLFTKKGLIDGRNVKHRHRL